MYSLTLLALATTVLGLNTPNLTPKDTEATHASCNLTKAYTKLHIQARSPSKTQYAGLAPGPRRNSDYYYIADFVPEAKYASNFLLGYGSVLYGGTRSTAFTDTKANLSTILFGFDGHGPSKDYTHIHCPLGKDDCLKCANGENNVVQFCPKDCETDGVPCGGMALGKELDARCEAMQLSAVCAS